VTPLQQPPKGELRCILKTEESQVVKHPGGYSWAFGAQGERIVSALLKKAGYAVDLHFNYRGQQDEGAPILKGFLNGVDKPENHIIRPDILVIGKENFWGEVKAKGICHYPKWAPNGIHCIDKHAWQHYVRINAASPTLPVLIFIYQRSTGQVLVASVAQLSEPGAMLDKEGYIIKGGRRKPVYNFHREVFTVWADSYDEDMRMPDEEPPAPPPQGRLFDK
jgi:hypothetical protein